MSRLLGRKIKCEYIFIIFFFSGDGGRGLFGIGKEKFLFLVLGGGLLLGFLKVKYFES